MYPECWAVVHTWGSCCGKHCSWTVWCDHPGQHPEKTCAWPVNPARCLRRSTSPNLSKKKRIHGAWFPCYLMKPISVFEPLALLFRFCHFVPWRVVLLWKAQPHPGVFGLWRRVEFWTSQIIRWTPWRQQTMAGCQNWICIRGSDKEMEVGFVSVFLCIISQSCDSKQEISQLWIQFWTFCHTRRGSNKAVWIIHPTLLNRKSRPSAEPCKVTLYPTRISRITTEDVLVK